MDFYLFSFDRSIEIELMSLNFYISIHTVDFGVGSISYCCRPISYGLRRSYGYTFFPADGLEIVNLRSLNLYNIFGENGFVRESKKLC